MNNFLHPAQAAELLGVSVQQVKRLAANGFVPCHRTPGGHRRFALSDLVALLKKERTIYLDVMAKAAEFRD